MVPNSDERQYRPNRHQRRPRHREVEPRLTLALDEQIDRRRARRRRQRGVLERIQCQHPHLPIVLRTSPSKNVVVQRPSTLGEKRAETDRHDPNRLAPADPRPVLDMRHRSIRQHIGRERRQLSAKPNREPKRQTRTQLIDNRLPTSQRRHHRQRPAKQHRGNHDRHPNGQTIKPPPHRGAVTRNRPPLHQAEAPHAFHRLRGPGRGIALRPGHGDATALVSSR